MSDRRRILSERRSAARFKLKAEVHIQNCLLPSTAAAIRQPVIAVSGSGDGDAASASVRHAGRRRQEPQSPHEVQTDVRQTCFN